MGGGGETSAPGYVETSALGRVESPSPGGFTLIEMLIVVVIIALLAALLMPAIGAAIRTARNAAVTAEINLMAQALENFKASRGEYPPSRILLSETGVYANDATTNSYAKGVVDITDGALATRSVAWLRKLWPRMNLAVGPGGSPPGAPSIPGPLGFYDWNNNGVKDTPYVLTGDECLVFFLGGIPSSIRQTPSAPLRYGLNGFNNDSTNPSLAPIVTVGGNPFYFARRDNPLLEFNSGRLIDLDGDGMPSYIDSLSTQMAYYYFSAYGNGNYDPSDNDLPSEDDGSGVAPITLKFAVGFPLSNGTRFAVSAAPNPYTATTTNPAGAVPIYQRPSTFQILSSGYDGLLGVGGQYVPGGGVALPVDAANTTPSGSSQALRVRESDNLSNISAGKLD